MTGDLRLPLLYHIGDAPVSQKLHVRMVDVPSKTGFGDLSLGAERNAGKTTPDTLAHCPRVSGMKDSGIECVLNNGYGTFPSGKAA